MTTTPTAVEQVRAAERGQALDALRALVVVGLVFFHSAAWHSIRRRGVAGFAVSGCAGCWCHWCSPR
jgi:peptidoglycan/LPS O-acetylase OafA/YrhL